MNEVCSTKWKWIFLSTFGLEAMWQPPWHGHPFQGCPPNSSMGSPLVPHPGVLPCGGCGGCGPPVHPMGPQLSSCGPSGQWLPQARVDGIPLLWWIRRAWIVTTITLQYLALLLHMVLLLWLSNLVLWIHIHDKIQFQILHPRHLCRALARTSTSWKKDLEQLSTRNLKVWPKL